jgi:hypothetical protein
MNTYEKALIGIAAVIVGAEAISQYATARDLAARGIKITETPTAIGSERLYGVVKQAGTPLPGAMVEIKMTYKNKAGGWDGWSSRGLSLTDSLGQFFFYKSTTNTNPLPPIPVYPDSYMVLWAYTSTRPIFVNSLVINFRAGYDIFVEMEVR